jgi:hypothetical protein
MGLYGIYATEASPLIEDSPPFALFLAGPRASTSGVCGTIEHMFATDPRALPSEDLETELAAISGSIAAGECRFLLLLAEFDRRAEWVNQGATSCAHWLSWRCSISPMTAREKVRVARSLERLPLTTQAFAQGRLSFSQVRALTRVATASNEPDLLEMAGRMPVSNLEVAISAYRKVQTNDLDAVNARHDARRVDYEYEDDGSVVLRTRLSPEDGALVLQALDAAADDLRRKEKEENVSAETLSYLARMADGLVAMAASYLENGLPLRPLERYQVLVHVDAEALVADADEARSHIERGAAVAPETVRRLTCEAPMVGVVEQDGKVLDLGRKTRAISPALRRALGNRDGGCRFPSCGRKKFVDAHHLEHWARGGKTKLSNLVQLCRHHHRLVHEGGFRVVERNDDFVFVTPDGRVIAESPQSQKPEFIEMKTYFNVDAENCRSGWDGSRVDIADVVDTLCLQDRRRLELAETQ